MDYAFHSNPQLISQPDNDVSDVSNTPNRKTVPIVFDEVRARTILTRVQAELERLLFRENSPDLELSTILARLPEDMRLQVKSMFEKWRLGLESNVECIRLLLALHAALEQPPFSDENEARLAVAIASLNPGSREHVLEDVDARDALALDVCEALVLGYEYW